MDGGFIYRLRSSIAKKGISASELSRVSGVGKGDISHYLKGDYLPKQDKVFMLAKALDVDPGWLVTGVEPRIEVAERQVPIVIPDTEMFKKFVSYMPEDDYQMVMAAFERAAKRMQEAEEKNK